MLPPFSPEVVWIVAAGYIVSFLLAFGIGANDVANSFGTSVGSKVLTLRRACILASIFEVAGAILIGYKVSDTIRKGIMDIEIYHGFEKELMLGSLAALGGSAIWLLVATFFKLPISGTHSIVGATLGYTLVARGTTGVNWSTLATIVGSWFVSPVLSGIISVLIFILVRHLVLSKAHPLEPGLKTLPVFYCVTIFINVLSIVHDGPSLLYFDRIPWWGAIIISVSIGIITALVVQFFLVPRQRRKIIAELAKAEASNPRVNFTFGDSAGTSANTTPADSRAISMEDLRGVGKQPIPVIPSSDLQVPKTYHFPALSDGVSDPTLKVPHQNGNANHEEKESLTQNGSLVKENGVAEKVMPTSKGFLGVPNSPTSESLGLQHNSSQVPLVAVHTSKSQAEMIIPMGSDPVTGKRDPSEDPPEAAHLFSFLQIMTASFGSFAHGGNDVSNAIGPLIALWLIYQDGNVHQKTETPIYILLFGGLGISVGLWIWGRRVIKTLGEDLTKITPSSGFTIEIGAAFTVLLASKIGIPISTTHCKVGSVVFVGWTRSKQGVDWHLFRNIILAWIVTLPISGGLSALLMAIFRAAAL